jgi:hypothetical protein
MNVTTRSRSGPEVEAAVKAYKARAWSTFLVLGAPMTVSVVLGRGPLIRVFLNASFGFGFQTHSGTDVKLVIYTHHRRGAGRRWREEDRKTETRTRRRKTGDEDDD